MDFEYFIGECMRSLKSDYPDKDQRFAICKSKWDRGETDIKKFNLQESGNLQNEDKKEKKEILIFPSGKYFVEKYDKWFVFNNDFFEKIIDTFKKSNLPKPFIDIDHNEGESLGEVIDLYYNEEGLKGVIELNNLGREIIKNNIYRYISPYWGEIIDNNGKKWDYYLKSVSLTNIPALLNNMPEINKQIKFNFKGGAMGTNNNFLLSQITDDAIKKVVEDLIKQGEKKEEIITSLENQINELKTKLEETEKQKEELLKENQTIKEEMAEKEAEEFVKKQLNNKKIDIAVVDYWKKHYKLNKEETIKYFETLEKKQDDEVAYKLSNKFNLSNDDIIVMKSCNLDYKNEKDIDFYLKAIRGIK